MMSYPCKTKNILTELISKACVTVGVIVLVSYSIFVCLFVFSLAVDWVGSIKF